MQDGGGTALNGKSAVPLLSKRNDVTREWLVTRHSRIQLQIAFAPNGPAAMFQFAAAGRKTCSRDDFNIADRLSRGLRRDTLERTRAGLVCLPVARSLARSRRSMFFSSSTICFPIRILNLNFVFHLSVGNGMSISYLRN